LWLVGAPSPLALAALAAFADLVPFVGGILMTVPAVLAALTRGPAQAVIVLIGILFYQEFESRFLVPRVYGRTLRLSPIAVTLALMVGARLLGVVGALLALPLAAGIRVLIQDLRVDLPGEEVAEPAEHAELDRAEAAFAVQTEGATAAESSVLAGSLAEQHHAQAGASGGG
jgi:predicted PurR-regulated permease PerM